ncbi:LamG-like jellyroll fold domain-containing protein [Caballeronia sp. LZ032]|uniref:LamG-like jellyroll fold domain-containing protein n=1 Tax=Caballeronia sp. LZ032 TaxID=3038565 RepID=UPI0038D4B0F4
MSTGRRRNRLSSSSAETGITWTHVTVKRQAGTVTVYVNGVASGSGGWAAPFWITGVGQPQGGNIMGRLAHVVMTNQALTASQIQAQAGMPASGLAQWMP